MVIPLVYKLWIPRPTAIASLDFPAGYESDEVTVTEAYEPVATSEDVSALEEGSSLVSPKPVALTIADKRRLIKPLIFKYMLPLCKFDKQEIIKSYKLTLSLDFQSVFTR